jgi:hypothetical protein
MHAFISRVTARRCRSEHICIAMRTCVMHMVNFDCHRDTLIHFNLLRTRSSCNTIDINRININLCAHLQTLAKETKGGKKRKKPTHIYQYCSNSKCDQSGPSKFNVNQHTHPGVDPHMRPCVRCMGCDRPIPTADDCAHEARVRVHTARLDDAFRSFPRGFVGGQLEKVMPTGFRIQALFPTGRQRVNGGGGGGGGGRGHRGGKSEVD